MGSLKSLGIMAVALPAVFGCYVGVTENDGGTADSAIAQDSGFSNDSGLKPDAAEAPDAGKDSDTGTLQDSGIMQDAGTCTEGYFRYDDTACNHVYSPDGGGGSCYHVGDGKCYKTCVSDEECAGEPLGDECRRLGLYEHSDYGCQTVIKICTTIYSGCL